MSDASAFVRRTKNADRDDINKLLALITPIAFAQPEDAGVQERITLSKATRLRTLTATTAILDVTNTDIRNKGTGDFRRQIPTIVPIYDLTHTTTNTITPIKVTVDQMGAGCHGVGTGYVTITDHALLDLTTEATVDCWIYPKASAGNGIILQKSGAYCLRIRNTNILEWFVNAKTPVTYDYTANINSWIHVTATYKSSASGQKLYIGSSLQSSDAESGAISTNANDVKIMGDGTSNLPSGFGVAHLSLLSNEVNSTWVTNSNSGIKDFLTKTEVTTIPFDGDEYPQPNARVGLFQIN